MIKNKEEIKAGVIIVNEKKHFKQVMKVTRVTSDYVYGMLGTIETCMPIDFYLGKMYQIKIA